MLITRIYIIVILHRNMKKTGGKYHFEREYAKTKGAYWKSTPSPRLISFEKLLKSLNNYK